MSSTKVTSEKNEIQVPVDFHIFSSTPLDRLIQVLEISFIFLLSYTLILLLDSVLERFGVYKPLSSKYLGEAGIGSLNGGNFESVVRITVIFNLLLFVFSLIFGIWIRRTRDGWTLKQLGYTLSTRGYGFVDLLKKAIVLGLLAILVFLGIMSSVSFLLKGKNGALLFNSYTYQENGRIVFYDHKALLAEYYFGFLEMSLIWPVSAGFFFFSYAYNSLKAKFSESIANFLSSLFYVFYLTFFFLIPSKDKLTQLGARLSNPVAPDNLMFWAMASSLFIVVYLFFSAFAETKSLVVPFTANFVFNSGLTLIRAGNSLLFGSSVGGHLSLYAMLAPHVVIVLVLLVWFFLDKNSFATLPISWEHLKNTRESSSWRTFGYLILFILLAFLLPSFLAEVLISSKPSSGEWIVPVTFGSELALLLLLAIIILTYDPNEVYDVLLINKEGGQPITSHIELFQTDDVLISGFFTALSSVGEELERGSSGLKSVQLGEKTVLVEEGVFTRLVALADKEQPSLRNSIAKLHREFEIQHGKEAADMFGEIPKEAQELVDSIGELSITFYIPQQVRWLGFLTTAITPLMLILIGLL